MRFPLLVLHIAGGMIGLLSGCVAMVYRKGSRGHRISGDVFVVSMLIMGACASCLAWIKHQPNNLFAGPIMFYLITTAWLTGRHQECKTSLFDWGAMVFASVLGSSMMTLGVLVALGQVAKQPGVPLGMVFLMPSIVMLAAAGDVRMLLRGGIAGTARLARHLWRMCFAWFIATGSFFLGQQQVIPPALRKQALLVPLALMPLGFLVYWWLRISVLKRATFVVRTERARV